jgi:hypothetical protein
VGDGDWGGREVDNEDALSASVLDGILVEDLKPRTETGIEFVPPLEEHRRWPAEQQFPRNVCSVIPCGVAA